MTTEEKKPIKGEEFLRRSAQAILRKANGQPSPTGQDNGEYYEREIRKARSRRELEEEERKLRELDKPPESPFQIRGGINVGEIDLQEQQRRREQEMDADRMAAAQRAQELEQENKRLQEQLYTERVDSLRRDFGEQMNAIQKTIQSGGPQKTFAEQYSEVLATAQQLGLEKTAAGRDPMIELELAKLQFQTAKEDREFKWKMRQDDKAFQLQMQQMQDDREFRRAELAQQAKKDEMIASFPSRIGGAIAKGVMDGVSDNEAPAAAAAAGSDGRKSYHVEIGEGESGEAVCANCGSGVWVGPSTKTAVCAKCSGKFRVTRRPKMAQQSPPEGVPAGQISDDEDEE